MCLCVSPQAAWCPWWLVWFLVDYLLMVHSTSLMTQRTSRSHCVSLATLVRMCWVSDKWLKHPACVMSRWFLFLFFQWPLESSPLWWERDTRSLENLCLLALWRGWGQSQTCSTCIWLWNDVTHLLNSLISLSHSLLMVFRLLLLFMAWAEERHRPDWGLSTNKPCFVKKTFPVNILKQVICFVW